MENAIAPRAQLHLKNNVMESTIARKLDCNKNAIKPKTHLHLE